jgi:hypothetical protein
MCYNFIQFNARQPRIAQLRYDIEVFSEELAMKQNHQDGIRAEAFAYVCQLQQSAAMLAPVDSDKEDESNYTTRSNDDTSSSYKHESERVSFLLISMQ